MTKRDPMRPIDGYIYSPGKLQTLGEAAHTLGIDRARLWQQCEQKAGRSDEPAVVPLEDGVVAIRWAGNWKFRFPLAAAANSEGA